MQEKQEKRRLLAPGERKEIRERIYRNRFVVPNAVTVGNMFCGFLAILYATSGRLEKAVIAIGLAILLDGLDGRVARRLNATSKFGLEFDSLSDLISFGVAPAILLYHWSFFQQMRADEFGVFVAFIYAVCAASRLARFNLQDAPSSVGFVGLPSPGAAGAVAALVNFAPKVEPTLIVLALSTAVLAGLGFLMVSRIPFLSIKKLKIGQLKLSATLLIASIIGLIWYNNSVGFLVLAMGYALSGPLMWLLGRKKGV